MRYFRLGETTFLDEERRKAPSIHRLPPAHRTRTLQQAHSRLLDGHHPPAKNLPGRRLPTNPRHPPRQSHFGRRSPTRRLHPLRKTQPLRLPPGHLPNSLPHPLLRNSHLTPLPPPNRPNNLATNRHSPSLRSRGTACRARLAFSPHPKHRPDVTNSAHSSPTLTPLHSHPNIQRHLAHPSRE